MFYKTALKIIATILYFGGCGLLFNHVEAWLGIGMTVLGIVFILNYFIQKIKKETK